ncbi:MAG TPA: hypothetical protein VGB63_11980 [Pedobacter sp.]|jgi:hypothetical protein
MNKRTQLQILLLFSSATAFCQTHSIDAGIRLQKSVGLYYENGITAQYNFNKRWTGGISYVSSRLGSALGTNALKQDNFIISGGYHFRPSKSLKPFLRFNTGYFSADYESEIFETLPNSSLLASLDAGLAYQFKSPLKINFSVGYNAISGDGLDSPGTLYPVFLQSSITWNIKIKKHEKD